MPSINLAIHPPVIAHRGASLYAPENTLAAFRAAKELGANWVEFDIMLSKDEEVVVIHDELLDRTTNFKGRVADYPYSHLQTLDAGSWFNPRFSQEKISNLRTVIELLNELELSANIEIKAQKGKEELTVKKMLQLVNNYWKNSIAPPLISSFSISVLECVRKYSDNALLAFLMHEWNDEWKTISERLQCSAIDVNHKILDPAKVNLIKTTNRLLLAYTVNDPRRARELFSWGVDAVFSDCPEQMLPILLL